MENSNDIVLIYPPHASMTHPYLSLPSLTAYLRQAGFKVLQYDAGIETFDLLMEPERIKLHLNKIESVLNNVSDKRIPREKRAKLELAKACGNFVQNNLTEAKQFFRSHDDFFNTDSYTKAHNVIKRAMDIISAAYYPLTMKFNELNYNKILSWPTIYKLSLSKSANPYLGIIMDEILPKLLCNAYIYGISITYQTQLVSAYTFARLIKKIQPWAKVVFGGAYLTSIRNGIIGNPASFKYVDAYIFGEGESPLLTLAKLASAGQPFPEQMESVHLPNDGKTVEDFILSSLNSEDFTILPTPDYKGLKLNLYLSPEPILLLSNARGCYWRKCAFCSVSCATGKTFRQRKIGQLKKDIDTLSSQYGVSYFFFADDCIPPRRLREIADHCHQRNIYWQTEARYERQLDPAYLRNLYEGGCLQLTFGNESGNQRVLDLMEKGTKVKRNEQIIIDTDQAGIAVQLQNFIGFPSETADEATQTVDQLVRLRKHITSFALGTFHLMKDSSCGREPEKFGIADLQVKRTNDIYPPIQFNVTAGMSQAQTKELFKRLLKRLMRAFPHNDYFLDGPVGAHIMLYLEKNRLESQPSIPFSSPDPNIVELLATSLKINTDSLTVIGSNEPGLSVIFHHKTGECVPIMNDHLNLVMNLDGSFPIIEELVETSMQNNKLNEASIAAHTMVIYDMLRKEVITPC